MREPNRILTAQDLMTTSLITFRPNQTILDAIQVLTKNGVSGGPVIDEEGRLVGILSELDCLRMLAHATDGQREDTDADDHARRVTNSARQARSCVDAVQHCRD